MEIDPGAMQVRKKYSSSAGNWPKSHAGQKQKALPLLTTDRWSENK